MMEEKEVAKAVNAELDRAESFMDVRISHERKLAYDYYYGKLFGNEQEGSSQVISCDVAQAVDSAVPAIVKVFVSGDKAVEFQPRGPEDVKSSEQATVLANYVFFTQNNGYALAHDFIKDGLLQKTGAFKWKWDTSVTISEKEFQGLTADEFQLLGQAPDWEVIPESIKRYPDPQSGTLTDVKVRIKKQAGKVKIIVPAPEEILISPDAMGLEVMEMPFIAHTPLLTASDLVELGVKPEVIKTLPKGDKRQTSDERLARKDRTDSSALTEDGPDLYLYCECYIRLDEDGDGIAELRKVCMVGDVILHNELVDHIPIAIWTPKVMPHEVVGISLADDVMDIQLLKSTIWRMTMNSWYQSVYPRIFTRGDVNIDDVMTIKPGGPIRGGPNSEAVPITVPFTGQTGFNMLEYADQEEEVRTGVSRLFQGLDPQAINKTATGVTAILNQANARVELVARNAAEFGFKPLFKGIMYLLAKHQHTALTVRLTNTFVPVDPETWSKEYDMTCNVGLGMGTKDQQLMHLQALGMDLQAIAQSPYGSQLLTAQHVFNYVEKKANLMGFRDATEFVQKPVDPQTGQPLPPPPPPKPESVQVAEIKAQGEQQKLAADTQANGQKMEQEAGLKKFEIQEQMKLEAFKAQQQKDLEVFKAQLAQQTEIEKANIAANAQVRTVKKMETGEDPEDPEEQEKRRVEDERVMRRDQIAEGTHAALLKMAQRKGMSFRRGKDGRISDVDFR